MKHSIKTTKDCYILLANDYVIMNHTGALVSLDEQGKQKVVQTHKDQQHNNRRYYKFNHPQYWFVPDTSFKPTEVKITLWMKINYHINRLF